MKSHCFCMNCDAVIGYSETTSIWFVLLCTYVLVDLLYTYSHSIYMLCFFIHVYSDGLCVFAATGTAVVTSSCDTAPESPDSQIARGICECKYNNAASICDCKIFSSASK